MRFLLFCLWGLALNAPLFAQEFGGHPPGLGWRQLNTPAVRVIFPEGADVQARRIANVINYLNENNARSIGEATGRIDVVLQTQTIIPNGYVGLAPRRSEFFATPFQSFHRLGTTDWIDALAIHEYRHVQQFYHARRGITRIGSWLQGQYGWLALSNLSIPNWFWEGDAVVAETALTTGGRGRLPSFFLEQRALLRANRGYSYMKVRNGSFVDLVPNHYKLGYVLTTYARDTFGNDVWRDIVADAGAYRPLFYSFSGALRRRTGLTTPELYRRAYHQLEEEYDELVAGLQLTPTRQVSPPAEKVVTNYRWPHPQPDGSVVALRNSYRQTEEVVRLTPGGREQVLTSVGYQTEPYLSVVNGRAVWTELEQHPRWYNRNYSVLVTYDLRNGQKERLTSQSKLFSPVYHPSDGRILAVRIEPDLRSQLVIVDAADGRIVQALPNAENDFLAFPRWSDDGRSIFYIARRGNELAIFRHEAASGARTRLTDWTTHVIDHLHVAGERVYFSASYQDIDNIYYLEADGEPRQPVQVTSVPVGAYTPAVNEAGDTLLMSEFTDWGYVATAMPLAQALAQPLAARAAMGVRYPDVATFAEEGGNMLERVPDSAYFSRPYNGLFPGLQLHSWSFNGSYTTPGVELLLENVLSNVRGGFGATYNRNEDRMSYNAELTYAGLFPWIEAAGSLSRRRTVYLAPSDSLRVQDFQQLSIGGGLSVPLQWLQGNYSTQLQLGAAYQHLQLSDYERAETAPAAAGFGTLDLSLTATHLHRQALQHVQPRFGLVGLFSYQRALLAQTGDRFFTRGFLYLPGLHPTHGIRLEGAYQREPLTNPYQFVDAFPYPRGYSAPINDEAFSWGASYQLPLAYPDWGFGGLTYFKRIRATAFYNEGQFRFWRSDFRRTMRSVGAELRFDNEWLNVQPITLGVRASYLLLEDIFEPERRWDFQLIVEGLLN